jgi:signal transduction histidine kinase
MLAKLRRRFILITMGLVGLVLLVVLIVSVVSSYQTTAARIELAADQALGRGPDSGQRPWIGGRSTGQPPITTPLEVPEQDSSTLNMRRDRGQEQDSLLPQINAGANDPLTPIYVTSAGQFVPVYLVNVEQSSFAILGDNSAFVSIDDSLADTALARIKEKLSRQDLTEGAGITGLLLDIKLFYRVETVGGSGSYGDSGDSGIVTIALADASSLIDTTLQMMGVSALIWLGAMVVLFFVSLLLSRMALRPVADAWERQRRFVADASHELKTPLTVILANNSLLLSHPSKTITEQQQWIDSTQAEAQRMDSLVRDLLLLAQTDREEERLKPSASSAGSSSVDFSALIRHKLLQFEAVFFERDVRLETDIADDISVPGDEEQLERLVQILLDNASKYAKAPAFAPIATVRVTLRPCAVTNSDPATSPALSFGTDTRFIAHMKSKASTKRHATLMIANTGDAIDPEDLPHLFERFYRTDSARSDTEGSGLGLSLAQVIVEAHHGNIRATSDPTNGTIFTVTL